MERDATCLTCKHFEPTGEGGNLARGRCMRFPPQTSAAVVGTDGKGEFLWADRSIMPAVHTKMWCGEWKLGLASA